jgi:hypothetical protein
MYRKFCFPEIESHVTYSKLNLCLVTWKAEERKTEETKSWIIVFYDLGLAVGKMVKYSESHILCFLLFCYRRNDKDTSTNSYSHVA